MSVSDGSVTVTGRVLDVQNLSGVAAESGRAWAFTVVSVLAGKTIQEIRWDQQRSQGAPPVEGDEVAVEVELSTYKGRVQATALKYARPVAAVKAS